MHIRRIAAAGATAGLLALVGSVSAAGPASAANWACTSETYQWSGEATLQPGTALATGVSVPTQQGTDIVVTGTSSDALDSQGFASALSVTIGGASASIGATVPGGEIVLQHTSGAAPLTAYGASVTVNRCTTVAQEGPVPPASGSSGGGASAGTGRLPATGAEMGVLVAAAGALVLAGAAAAAAARRSAA